MKNKTPKTAKTVIGIDLGDKQHSVCVLNQAGKILKEYSIRNRHRDLEQLAKDWPKARIAMEVGTHSPWISRLLAARGAQQVIVANARKLRAIYTNDRKCDKQDALMIAKLARVDPELLCPVIHSTEQAQLDLISLKARDLLVKQRTQLIRSVKCLLKSIGIDLEPNSAYLFGEKARAWLLANHPQALEVVDPSLHIADELHKQIFEYNAIIKKIAHERYPETELLRQIPGVGPITSLYFVLVIGDPQRFQDARDVGAYLGLVPRRDQSGGSDKQLPISKAGNRCLRSLLVQCAQYILGHYGPDSDLRRQGLKMAARGGTAAKRKAVVAIARKLGVLMLTLWRDASDYEPLRKRATKQLAKAA